MDPYRASSRRDREVVTWNCSLGRHRRFAAHGRLVVVVHDAGRAAVGAGVVAAEESVRGKGLARIQSSLGHRPCRLAHRTPVLYSRNQSRTNIALSKEKG